MCASSVDLPSSRTNGMMPEPRTNKLIEPRFSRAFVPAAHEMDYLDPVAFADLGLVPLVAAHNPLVNFDGDSLGRERQLLNQLAQIQFVAQKLSRVAVDVNLQRVLKWLGRMNDAPQLGDFSVRFGANQNGRAAGFEVGK